VVLHSIISSARATSIKDDTPLPFREPAIAPKGVGADSHGPGLMEPKYWIVWLELASFRYRGTLPTGCRPIRIAVPMLVGITDHTHGVPMFNYLF
jgi:hypothetical protein